MYNKVVHSDVNVQLVTSFFLSYYLNWGLQSLRSGNQLLYADPLYRPLSTLDLSQTHIMAYSSHLHSTVYDQLSIRMHCFCYDMAWKVSVMVFNYSVFGLARLMLL